MRLLIVRHGIAMERENYVGNDDFRPLTLDGIKRMRKNARGLKELVDRPTILASSPLTRAHQTAEILQEVWHGLEIVPCECLRPETKPQALATWINERLESGEETIAVTGHEPHLSTIVHWMTGGFVELKKGGACVIEFDHRISKGDGRLKWLATPRLLKSV